MKNNLRVLLLVLFLIPIITSCTSLMFPERPTYTPPITDESGEVIEGSIAVLEYLTINGIDQSLCIRGYSTENPVLLFLHGGPGFALSGWREMYITPELEQNFTIVLWDQRGAGRSYHDYLTKDDMSIAQMVADTYYLINYLRKRFNQEKIYLFGHSFGSALGFLTLMAYDNYPDIIAAYISAGEAVDWNRRHQISYDWTLEQAYARDNSQAINELEKLQPFDSTNDDHVSIKNKWVPEFGGDVADMAKFEELKAMAGKTPEYSPADVYRFMQGLSFSPEALNPEILSAGYNLFVQFPESKIPLFFLMGKKDYSTPIVLVEEYESFVNAPYTERFYFPEGAHFAYVMQPELFTQYMLSIRDIVENKTW
jgi:pimeloyl-ACP methyl ester carboxylesterase